AGDRVVSVRWERWLRVALMLFAMAVLLAFVAFESGWVERRVRDAVVSQLEEKTGARVELGGFHLHTLRLRAELDDLTLHGREGAGTAPFFHASRMSIRLRILSFFGGKFAVDELIAGRQKEKVKFKKAAPAILLSRSWPRTASR